MSKNFYPLKSVILQPLRNADLPGSLWLQDACFERANFWFVSEEILLFYNGLLKLKSH
jgi:hypothetical protein